MLPRSFTSASCPGQPTTEEKAEVQAYLGKNAGKREKALLQLAWALLASTEFGVNH